MPCGLFAPRGGGVITLARDELIVATAPDGSSVLVTTPCDGPGALTRRWLDGRVQELRARPAPAACAVNDDGADHVPVSAAFTADGRFVVYAVPSGAGWIARAVDPAGQVHTVRESADPLVVLGRP